MAPTVHHWCRTQDRIARSSGEAELKSACKGMNEGLGLLHLANFLLPQDTWSLSLAVDANAAIGMVHRQGAGDLKHLTVRTLWVQEAVKETGTTVLKVPRAINWSDALCSPRPVGGFEVAMRHLSLRDWLQKPPAA